MNRKKLAAIFTTLLLIQLSSIKTLTAEPRGERYAVIYGISDYAHAPMDADDAMDEYICPWDASSGHTSNIRDDELEARLDNLPCRKVVILDTCFSGGLRARPRYIHVLHPPRDHVPHPPRRRRPGQMGHRRRGVLLRWTQNHDVQSPPAPPAPRLRPR